MFLNLAWFFNALFYSDMEFWRVAWAGRQGAIRSTKSNLKEILLPVAAANNSSIIMHQSVFKLLVYILGGWVVVIVCQFGPALSIRRFVKSVPDAMATR